jgi:hypothetical protein
MFRALQLHSTVKVPVRELRAMARFRLAHNDVGERSDARAIGVPSPEELQERGVPVTYDSSGEVERITVAALPHAHRADGAATTATTTATKKPHHFNRHHFHHRWPTLPSRLAPS